MHIDIVKFLVSIVEKQLWITHHAWPILQSFVVK